MDRWLVLLGLTVSCVCRVGALSAGTLCALTTLSQQLDIEGTVDVYQVAKMINLMRPGVFTEMVSATVRLSWSNPCLSFPPRVCLSLLGPQDQYQYLYQAVLSLVGGEDNPPAPLSRNTNGTTASAPESDPGESLESLV